MARPSSYTPEIGNEICELMSEGKGLREICQAESMPSRSAVLRWVEKNEAFRDQYARAREALYDWIAEEIIRISDDSSGDYFIEDRDGKSIVVPDHARVQRARLQVDSRKWILSKLAPRKYGDKVELLAAADQPNKIEIRWQKIEHVIVDPAKEGFHAAKPPEPPRQLTYSPAPPPADLSPEAWARIVRVSNLIEQIAPSDEMPEHVFGIIEAALREHFLS